MFVIPIRGNRFAVRKQLIFVSPNSYKFQIEESVIRLIHDLVASKMYLHDGNIVSRVFFYFIPRRIKSLQILKISWVKNCLEHYFCVCAVSIKTTSTLSFIAWLTALYATLAESLPCSPVTMEQYVCVCLFIGGN